MSKSQVQKGDILDLTAPTGGVVSGNAYLIGSILVVAQISAAQGETFSGAICGVHELPKESTTAVFAEGEKVFWDDTAKEFDESASGRYAAGVAVAAAGATDATVKVRLDAHALTAVP